MFEKIMSMTPDEIIMVNGLLVVAREAKAVAEKIRDKFTFKIGEDRIEVWADEYNHEYITHDGVWQARYLHHDEYDVMCSAEEIYKLFRAEYLIKNGFCESYDEGGNMTKEAEWMNICQYFRMFLTRTFESHSSFSEDLKADMKDFLSDLSGE